MIIGDPFKFAIGFNFIKEWNEIDSPWINGVYDIYIYGVRYSNNLHITEFNTNLKYLFYQLEKDIKLVGQDVVNKLLKNINDDIYISSLLENNFVFSLESADMNDEGLKIFYMSSRDSDHIIVHNIENIELFNFKNKEVIGVFQELSKISYTFFRNYNYYSE